MSEPLTIAVINPPYRSPTVPDTWITVPPEGYGGVQWVVAHLIDGLLALGHEVQLLGAPDSRSGHPRLSIVPGAEPLEMRRWLDHASVDIVHDHTNGIVRPQDVRRGAKYLSTHHQTGRPLHPQNCVYLSVAHRRDAGATDTAPVVRIPVNVSRYSVAEEKGDFLLFLGRVSRHKGAFEAAAFAQCAGLPLVIAGPSWEPDYRAQIESMNSQSVEFLGEIGGTVRRDLLAQAKAVLVLSQPTRGPWGGVWCEPGATVVSEAAASGTPVVATQNGCLAEIVPFVGNLVPYGATFSPRTVEKCLSNPPAPAHLRLEAETQWGHIKIAREYDALYRARIAGKAWR